MENNNPNMADNAPSNTTPSSLCMPPQVLGVRDQCLALLPNNLRPCKSQKILHVNVHPRDKPLGYQEPQDKEEARLDTTHPNFPSKGEISAIIARLPPTPVYSDQDVKSAYHEAMRGFVKKDELHHAQIGEREEQTGGEEEERGDEGAESEPQTEEEEEEAGPSTAQDETASEESEDEEDLEARLWDACLDKSADGDKEQERTQDNAANASEQKTSAEGTQQPSQDPQQQPSNSKRKAEDDLEREDNGKKRRDSKQDTSEPAGSTDQSAAGAAPPKTRETPDATDDSYQESAASLKNKTQREENTKKMRRLEDALKDADSQQHVLNGTVSSDEEAVEAARKALEAAEAKAIGSRDAAKSNTRLRHSLGLQVKLARNESAKLEQEGKDIGLKKGKRQSAKPSTKPTNIKPAHPAFGSTSFGAPGGFAQPSQSAWGGKSTNTFGHAGQSATNSPQSPTNPPQTPSQNGAKLSSSPAANPFGTGAQPGNNASYKQSSFFWTSAQERLKAEARQRAEETAKQRAYEEACRLEELRKQIEIEEKAKKDAEEKACKAEEEKAKAEKAKKAAAEKAKKDADEKAKKAADAKKKADDEKTRQQKKSEPAPKPTASTPQPAAVFEKPRIARASSSKEDYEKAWAEIMGAEMGTQKTIPCSLKELSPSLIKMQLRANTKFTVPLALINTWTPETLVKISTKVFLLEGYKVTYTSTPHKSKIVEVKPVKTTGSKEALEKLKSRLKKVCVAWHPDKIDGRLEKRGDGTDERMSENLYIKAILAGILELKNEVDAIVK